MARVDQVCLELSRADMEDTASRLTSCYTRLWETALEVAKSVEEGSLLLRYSRKVICANATTGEE